MAHENSDFESLPDAIAPAIIEVLPDLRFPRLISVRERAGAYRVGLRAVWSDDRRVYTVVAVEVAGSVEAPVTGSALRTIAIQDLFRRGVQVAARLSDGSPMPSVDDLIDRMESAGPGGRLEWAARVYVVARAYGDAPLLAVARLLDVSQSTATRIINSARTARMVD